MTEHLIITASLEGMRVVIDGKRCELHEYDFQKNRWFPRDAAEWPLPRPLADGWLAGWNHLDRFAAVSALTGSPDHPAEGRRALGPLKEPNFH